MSKKLKRKFSGLTGKKKYNKKIVRAKKSIEEVVNILNNK